MTSAEELRRFLAREGFSILREEATEEDGHIYSVMQVMYAPAQAVSYTHLDVYKRQVRKYARLQRVRPFRLPQPTLRIKRMAGIWRLCRTVLQGGLIPDM